MSDAATSRHFDMVFSATCGAEDVRAFLLDANRDAARAIAERFRDAATRGFWTRPPQLGCRRAGRHAGGGMSGRLDPELRPRLVPRRAAPDDGARWPARGA